MVALDPLANAIGSDANPLPPPAPPKNGATIVNPLQRPTGPQASDGELIQRVRFLLQQARDHRKPKVQLWDRCYRILEPRTWATTRPAWLPNPEVPEVQPIIESLVGWLTDQRPTQEVVPSAPIGTAYGSYLLDLADDLRICLDANADLTKQELHVTQMGMDGYITGTGVMKTRWNPVLNDGLGDAEAIRVDPYTIYPDPQANNADELNYVIEARRVSIQYVDRRYPGAAQRLASSGALLTENLDERPDPMKLGTAPFANPGPISPSTSPRYGLPGQSRRSFYDTSGVTLIECWVREHRTSGEGADLTIHDDWRCIVIAGNQVLMNERASDMWEHGGHPYDFWQPMPDGSFWGRSMVDMLRSAQLAINRLIASYMLNVDLTSDPPLVESGRAGMSRTVIANKPGQRIRINGQPNQDVQWMPVPPVRADIPNLISFFIERMESISGLSSITRGMAPGGRNASSVISDMQEASFVRVRKAMRQLEYLLADVGYKRASLITEFYVEPRSIAMVGSDGERAMRDIQAKHFYTPSAGDGKNRQMPLKFSLRIGAASALPTSRQARVTEYDTLFAMGAMDVLSVLEAHNIPNAQQIAQRIQAQQQAGQFAPPGARQAAGRTS